MKTGKLDIKEWTYAGHKLNNPLLIIWKLIWFIPFKISVVIMCLFALIGFGKYAAETLWRECQ